MTYGIWLKVCIIIWWINFPGIKKKVLALAKREECGIIGEWSKSIVNHMYWCAASSDDNEEMIKDKWLSLINHIYNKHQHSGLFKKCAHGRVDHNKKWFTPRMFMHYLN